MNKIKTLFITELKLSLRSPDTMLFVLLMPVIIVGIMRLISETNSSLTENLGAYLVIGVCAIGLMGLPLTLSEYRSRKILKKMQVTPATPGLLLGTQIMVQGLVAILSAFLVIFESVIIFGVNISGNPLSLILSWLIVLISIFSIGMIISSISKDVKQAGIICSIIYFPMLLLSGTTIPYSKFPEWMQSVGRILPLRQGIILMNGVLSGGGLMDYTPQILILLLISVIGIITSIKCFRWEM